MSSATSIRMQIFQWVLAAGFVMAALALWRHTPRVQAAPSAPGYGSVCPVGNSPPT